MSPNPDTVNGKLEVIHKGLQFLEEDEHDLSVYRDRQAVKYTLQESIEACLDIANHIIASEGLGRPDDYAEYFPCLARHDIIPDDLAAKLADMARFRNITRASLRRGEPARRSGHSPKRPRRPPSVHRTHLRVHGRTPVEHVCLLRVGTAVVDQPAADHGE
jgi:uncharacterized protein YutE (UPF0331/DUF86 family)